MRQKVFAVFTSILIFALGCIFVYKLTNRQFFITSLQLKEERCKFYNVIKENFGVIDINNQSITKIETINLYKNMDFYIVQENNVKTIRCAE